MALEKAARFKPNGRLLRRSPLSDLIELEWLLLGVQGKTAGFRALRRLADTDTDTDTDFRPTPSMSSSPAPSNKPTPWNNSAYTPQPTYSPHFDNARKASHAVGLHRPTPPLRCEVLLRGARSTGRIVGSGPSPLLWGRATDA